MSWIAITDWNAQNRVTSHKEFATQAEADAFLDGNADAKAGSFSAEKPSLGAPGDWIVDAGAGTLTVDTAGLLATVRAKKQADLSATLDRKRTPFSYDDGSGSADYRADGKLLQWLFMRAARIAINGGAGHHVLDGTRTSWVFAGLYPKTAADLQVFTVAASDGARTDLTHVASGPTAGQYTIAASNEDRLILTLGDAGTSGDTLCVKIGVGSINWVDVDLNKKSWTELQFQDFLRGMEDHLGACGVRYFQLHNAIESVTGTDAEKIAKLTDPADPDYVDLTTDWPTSSVN